MTNYTDINNQVLLIQSELAAITLKSNMNTFCGSQTETEQLTDALQLRITNLLEYLDGLINPK